MKIEKIPRILLNLLPFIFILVLMLIIHQNVRSFDADDSLFGRIQQQFSFRDYLVHRYLTWYGRLSIEAATYIVRSFHIKWWRLINSIMITGLCFSIAALVMGLRFWLEDNQAKRRTSWFICLGLGLFNINILSSSMFWLTGSFNYLWPMTAAGFVLIPFRERIGKEPARLSFLSVIGYIFPVLAAIYAGMGNEQVGVFLVGLTLLLNIGQFLKYRRIDPYLILLSCILIAGLIVMWAAPGNRIRYEQEITNWFPQFRELSFGQSLLLRMGWFLEKTININRILLVFLFTGITLKMRSNTSIQSLKVLGKVSGLIAVFLMIASINLEVLHPEFQAWFDGLFFTFHPLRDFASAFARLGKNLNFILFLIPYLLWVPVMIFIPYLIYRSWAGDRVKSTLFAFLFCAAAFSLVMITFSPTMIASANRTVALFSVITFFIISVYFYDLSDHVPIWILLPILLLALTNFLFLHIEWSKKYFIHW